MNIQNIHLNTSSTIHSFIHLAKSSQGTRHYAIFSLATQGILWLHTHPHPHTHTHTLGRAHFANFALHTLRRCLCEQSAKCALRLIERVFKVQPHFGVRSREIKVRVLARIPIPISLDVFTSALQLLATKTTRQFCGSSDKRVNRCVFCNYSASVCTCVCVCVNICVCVRVCISLCVGNCLSKYNNNKSHKLCKRQLNCAQATEAINIECSGHARLADAL